MVKGTSGEWYQNEHIGGYFDKSGSLIVCEEYGLTDAETDRCAIEVQNGDGYYDNEGRYKSYCKE